VKIVERLLSIRSINVNAKSKDGNSAVHFANALGSTEIIKLLLGLVPKYCSISLIKM
jgi:ankyrin repeat protein